MKRTSGSPALWIALLFTVCLATGSGVPLSGSNDQPPDQDQDQVSAQRAAIHERAQSQRMSNEVPPNWLSNIVVSPATATQLAQAIVGTGVTLTGTPVFVGNAAQAGTFTQFTTGPYTNPVTGPGSQSLPQGVIFSSGDASQAGLPKIPSGTFQGGASTGYGTPGDADLTALAGAATQDATSLTFQFIPTASSISFRFVFASTEYPNFVGSGFFDAIAIKVNNVNVATVPLTTVPVNVNTINLGRTGVVATRPELFTVYSTLNVTPFNYGGATVILAATAQVTPNVPNTIKIAVGDTGDTILDSAIILEGASLAACTYALLPTTKQITGDGGPGSVTVVTPPGCPWTPSSNVPWLTPTPATQQIGNTLNFTAQPNPDPVNRTGRIQIAADKFVDITQFPVTVATQLGGGTAPALSGNSRFLAFATIGALVAGDTNNSSDIYVVDRTNPNAATNKTRISVTDQGGQANNASFAPAISRDGRFIAFESDANNLVPGDTNAVRDVFLRDRDADGDGIYDEAGAVTTRLISRGSPNTLVGGGVVEGAIGQAASGAPAISADGSIVAFSSDANNLVFGDTNNARDIFLHVRADRKVYRVTNFGVAADRPALSGNGKVVAFDTTAAILPADGNALRDVYTFDWTPAGAPTAGNYALKSVQTGGTPGDSIDASVSDDGTLVAFASSAQLIPASDSNTSFDIYLRAASSTQLVSRTPAGSAAGGSAGAAISGDGKFVAFSTTAGGLSPFDTNGVEDVFVQIVASGAVRLVSSTTTGAVTGRSFEPSISTDGDKIAFATLGSLPSQKGDGYTLTPITNAEPGEAGIALSTPLPSITGVSAVVAPNHGPANQQTAVQIKGRNLYGINEVRFGNALGIGLNVFSDGTTIETTAPAQPTGTVSVRLANLVSTGIDVGNFSYDDQPPCTYQLTAPSTSIAAGGATSTLTVNTTPNTGCAWNLGKDADWISLSTSSGNGDGTVQVTIPQNTNPPQRAATIEVSNQAITYTQAGSGCTDSIEPASRAREVQPIAATDNGVVINTQPGCGWTSTANVPWLTPPASGAGAATVLYSIQANPGPGSRQGILTVQGPVTKADITVTQLAPAPPASCTFTGSPAPLNLTPTGGVRTVTINTQANCPWTARSDASWITLTGGTSGTQTGNITLNIAANDGTNRTGTVTLNINVQGASQPKLNVNEDGTKGGAPFGVVDQPGANATLNGSVPLTGWVLDDKPGVVVEIFAEEQAAGASGYFIGNATRVRGARPDVQGLYPTSAESDSAGWGYLLLSNQLAILRNGQRVGSGNGTFKLIFRSKDTDGNVTSLGDRIVTFNNSAAINPFGAIDTPDQGAEISGAAYNQFGWALTPLPKTIPTNGSTIQVLIDGVNIGSPSYNIPRSDIATLFPGLNNTNGPVGVLGLNTLALVNGVHTIAWVVFDNAGAGAGVGSRFFRVNNPGGLTPSTIMTAVPRDAVDALPVSAADVSMAHGLDGAATYVRTDETGTRHVNIHALDIVRFTLPGASEGYVVNGDALEALPIGSTFDAAQGTFAWQLGPGFAGVYNLVFVRDDGGNRERIPVRIVVSPETDEMPLKSPVSVDEVQSGVGPLTLNGTALSGEARELREVTVYAYPAGDEAPILVGGAPVAPAIKHVAEVQGGQFGRSAFAVSLESLPPGTYDLLVVARSAVSPALDSSTWVRGVTIK